MCLYIPANGIRYLEMPKEGVGYLESVVVGTCELINDVP